MRSWSPLATGIPTVERNEDIFVGPGSCRSGFGFGPPQVGRDAKSFAPQVAFCSSTRMPPPWRWPPPETIRPLCGIVKPADFVKRRKRPPAARDVEDRIRTSAVPDVEPDRLHRRQPLAGDVAHGVADEAVQSLGLVVHQHVEEAPAVGRLVRIAVAARQREREPLLTLGEEPLRGPAAGVVGCADLREDDVVQHHLVASLDAALRVDDLCLHPDDVPVDLRRLGGHRLLRDTVALDRDRGRREGQRALRRVRERRQRERRGCGCEQHARNPGHPGNCSSRFRGGTL